MTTKALETLKATVQAVDVLYAEAMSADPNPERMTHIYNEVMTGSIGARAVISGAAK
jgi:hypothetical protein